MDQAQFEAFMTELGSMAQHDGNTLAASIAVIAAKNAKQRGMKAAQVYTFRMLKQVMQLAEWADLQRLKNHTQSYADLEEQVMNA